jgi:tRNA(Ile)-lysidine synthase
VLQFLEDRGQTYCIDRSNRDTGFTRNRIRHELIPELSRTFPTFSSAALAALNESARESAEFIAAALDEKWAGILRASAEGAIVLEAGALSSLPAALRKEAMRRAVGLADPEASRALRADHIRAAAWLADAAVGTQIGLPRGLTARRDHGAVVIGAATPGRCQAEYTLPLPGRVSLPEAALVIHAEKMASDAPGPEDVREHSSPWEVYVDGTALTGPLTVRYRRPGDRFRPLGAPGTRSLKRFLIDCKVPRHRRDRIPLVLAPDGRILWAVGLRIADAFRLTGRSEQAVRLWETPLAGSTGQ